MNPESFEGIEKALKGELCPKKTKLEAIFDSSSNIFTSSMLQFSEDCWKLMGYSGNGLYLTPSLFTLSLILSGKNTFTEFDEFIPNYNPFNANSNYGSLLKSFPEIHLFAQKTSDGNICTYLSAEVDKILHNQDGTLLSITKPSFNEGYTALMGLTIPLRTIRRYFMGLTVEEKDAELPRF